MIRIKQLRWSSAQPRVAQPHPLGPMIRRLTKISICVLVAFVTGVVSYVAVEVAHSPGIWSHPDYLWSIAQAGAR
jgi:hypothetical protein